MYSKGTGEKQKMENKMKRITKGKKDGKHWDIVFSNAGDLYLRTVTKVTPIEAGHIIKEHERRKAITAHHMEEAMAGII